MSLVTTHPSSVAHTLPWEVLGAFCEQAHESTLVQLCLVSFGMLELAGPILYDTVDIVTPQRLYSFFVEPSLIPADSRLRSLLGPDLVRHLHVDYRRLDEDCAQVLFPKSTWERSDLRVSSLAALKTSDQHKRVKGGSCLNAAQSHVDNLLRSGHRHLHLYPPLSAPLGRSNLVDLEYTTSKPISRRPMTYKVHLNPLPLITHAFETLLRASTTQGDIPEGAIADFRRVTASTGSPSHPNAVSVSELVTFSLQDDCVPSTFQMQFLVATPEVEKLIKDAINASSADQDRQDRCHVVRA